QAGLFLFVTLLVFIMFLFVRRSEHSIHHNNVQLFMFLLIFTLNVLAMYIVSLGQNSNYPYIAFLAPVAMGSVLTAKLLNTSLVIAASILFSMIASVMFKLDTETMLFDYSYGFVFAVVCIVSTFVIRKAGQRSTILKAGITISLFSVISLSSLILLNNVT